MVLRLPSTFDKLLVDGLGTRTWETYNKQDGVMPSQNESISLAILIGGDYAPGLFHETIGKKKNYFPPVHVITTLLKASQSKLSMFDDVSAADSLVLAHGQPTDQALGRWGLQMYQKVRSALQHEKTWHVSPCPDPWPVRSALDLYLCPIVSADTRPPHVNLWTTGAAAGDGDDDDEFRGGYVSIERVVEVMLDFLPGTDLYAFLSYFEGDTRTAIFYPVGGEERPPPSPEQRHYVNRARSKEATVWRAVIASSVRYAITKNHAHGGPVWSALLPRSSSTFARTHEAKPVVDAASAEEDDDDKEVRLWRVDRARRTLRDKLRREGVPDRDDMVELYKGEPVSFAIADRRVREMYETPIPSRSGER